ncbi:MAG: histidinol-phosphatase [Erysipelotrichaceae bacterium]
MIKTNFHTHTTRCNHASGSDEEYVLAAIQAGFKVLGFSDHNPWKYQSDYVAPSRMELTQMEGYCQSILALKEKYKSQIEIKLGLECEYFPMYMEWFKDFLNQYPIDYIIFGNHFYKTDEHRLYYGATCTNSEFLNLYREDCIAGMATGLYSYLAHPDLFMRADATWTKEKEEISYDICKHALKYDVPLEYNLNGLALNLMQGVERYPHPEFFKIAAKVGNQVIIGVDAHIPSLLADETLYQLALKNLKEYGCNIINEINYQCWK